MLGWDERNTSWKKYEPVIILMKIKAHSSADHIIKNICFSQRALRSTLKQHMWNWLSMLCFRKVVQVDLRSGISGEDPLSFQEIKMNNVLWYMTSDFL